MLCDHFGAPILSPLGASFFVTLQALLDSKPLDAIRDSDYANLVRDHGRDAAAPGGRDALLDVPTPPIPAAFRGVVTGKVLKPSVKVLDGFTKVFQTSAPGYPDIEVHVDSGLSHSAGLSRYWARCLCGEHGPCMKHRQCNHFSSHVCGVSWMAAWAVSGTGLSRLDHINYIPADALISVFKPNVVQLL